MHIALKGQTKCFGKEVQYHANMSNPGINENKNGVCFIQKCLAFNINQVVWENVENYCETCSTFCCIPRRGWKKKDLSK